ncbi:hypothetical protein C8J57DRAFT_1576245 [Mycena rebaudengoi]|nr:hypothetical protein C8J57DRAFT_1576245 [Mycena rebaudengoi]
MPLNNLPQELLDDIFGHIDDTESLRHCSTAAARFNGLLLSPRISPHRRLRHGTAIAYPYPENDSGQRMAVTILHAAGPCTSKPSTLVASSCGPLSTLFIHIDMETLAEVPTLLPNRPLRSLILLESAQKTVPVCDILLRTQCLANLERLWLGIHGTGSRYNTRLLNLGSLLVEKEALCVIPTVAHQFFLGSTPLLHSVDLPLMPHVRTLTLHMAIMLGFPFSARFPLSTLSTSSPGPRVPRGVHLYPERTFRDADIVIKRCNAGAVTCSASYPSDYELRI